MNFQELDILSIIIIALGLSMDAFAVSLSAGFINKNLKRRYFFISSLSFGLFQAIMPLTGWFLGINLSKFISSVDHWIAFLLLLIIGSRMIYESSHLNKKEPNIDLSNFNNLIVLSIATSIDALSIGISLSFLRVSIYKPALLIGIITFIISLIGVYLGVKIGKFFGKKMGIVGGVLLILIGLRILFSHIWFK
jgi:putative Mn2+ efflux pump MntP